MCNRSSTGLWGVYVSGKITVLIRYSEECGNFVFFSSGVLNLPPFPVLLFPKPLRSYQNFSDGDEMGRSYETKYGIN